jgi:hypothetical protein
MPTNKLLETLKKMVEREKKIKYFKRLLRVKGVITAKSLTKKGNISLKIKKEEDECNFTVLKSHKERYALAEKLEIGNWVSVAGIPRFGTAICTQLKKIDKPIEEGKQYTLKDYA